MMKILLVAASTLASSVLAQAVTRAPVVTASYKLQCPSGTTQIGGVKSSLGMMACSKATSGRQVLHGPVVSLYASGKVEAIGESVDGERSGHWVFFDESGAKTGEADFLKGDYHGQRVEYARDGSVKVRENWARGQLVERATR